MAERQFIRRKRQGQEGQYTPSEPSQEPRTPRPKNTIWDMLKGQRLVIQCKTGTIIEGEFVDMDKGLLRINDVTVKGKTFIARPQWLLLERAAVAHIHPICEVEEIA